MRAVTVNVIVWCTLFSAVPALAQGSALGSTAPFLAAEATAEVHVPPDRAVVRLGVEQQAKDAAVAQRQVNTTMQKLMKALKDRGVPSERVTTDRLELVPVYEQVGRDAAPTPDERPRVVGFRATNVVRVQMPIEPGKAPRVGDVIDAAIKGGANTIEGISFELAHPLPHRARALRAAAEQAQEKTRTLAQALGVGVGRLIEAREGDVDVQPPGPQFAMERAMGSDATQISPGELTVRATVTVRYEIAR